MTIDPTIQLIKGVSPVNEIDEDRARVVKWLRALGRVEEAPWADGQDGLKRARVKLTKLCTSGKS